MPALPVFDYLVERWPETTADNALAALHEEVVARNIPLTGCRCSWNRAGRQCESDGRPELIPGLVMSALQFVLLPDGSDVALIKRDDRFGDRPTASLYVGKVNNFGGGITWVKADYDEKLGPAPHVHGWSELLLHLEALSRENKAQAIKRWVRTAYPKTFPAGVLDRKLWVQFENDESIKVDIRHFRRVAFGRT